MLEVLLLSRNLKSIIDAPQVNPDVLNLVETNLKKSKKIAIDGYKCFNRNRDNKNMGGVPTLVRNENVSNVLKVTEGQKDNEFLITRHSQFVIPINMILIYGEQESRVKYSEIDEKWEELMVEVKKIEARGEAVMSLGDFN